MNDSIDTKSCKRFFTNGSCEEFFYFLEDKFGNEYSHGLNYVFKKNTIHIEYFWIDKYLK